MPTLTITETFADGQVLFEADLDNILNSLEDFFNTTLVDATNVQPATLQKFIQPGTVVMYGSLTPPAGWLNCDGAIVSRLAFAALYGVIRDKYGAGDGTTTFNLPAFARQIPMGAGGTKVSSVAPDITVASQGGTEGHALITAEIPAHQHVSNSGDHGHNQQGTSGVGSTTNAQAVTNKQDGVPSFSPATTANGISTTTSTGGGGMHNNVQPSLVVNFIIKT